jgi:hypothetical protein
MSTIDEALEVERARSRILSIIAEIERLAATDLAEAEFFSGVLERVLAGRRRGAGRADLPCRRGAVGDRRAG